MRRPALRPRARRRVHDYQRMEDRRLLAAFQGTTGDDVIHIAFENDHPVRIEINGIEHVNPHPTLTLDSLEGNDEIRFSGATFHVAASVLDVPNEYRQITVGEINGLVNTMGSGTVTFITGQADDSFDVTGGDFEYGPIVKIRSGAGDDTVHYRGGVASIVMDEGDDHLISHVSFLGSLRSGDGGAGNDRMIWSEGVRARLDYRGLDTNGEVTWGYSVNSGDPYSYYRISRIEHFVANAPIGFDNFVIPNTGDSYDLATGLNYVLDGHRAVGTREGQITPVVLDNFNYFRQGDVGGSGERTGTFSVLGNDYELTLRGYARIEVGFRGVAASGLTDAVLAPIHASGGTVVVSDAANTGHDIKTVTVDQAHVGWYSVTGLTPAPVFVSASSRPGGILTLWGNQRGAGRYLLEATRFKTVVYGGLGTDVFIVGGSASQDLDRIEQGTVNIVGNGGGDYLYTNDQNSIGAFGYRVRDAWVHQTPDSQGNASRSFAGVWYTGVTRIVVNGNSDINQFRVTPSTRYEFILNFNGVVSGDRIQLVGNVPEYSVLETSATIWFGSPAANRPLPIRFSKITKVPMESWVALASQAGSPARVEVYQGGGEAPVRTWVPFPAAPNYRGGISVATGFIDGDYIPNVVVGMEQNGQSDVVVHRGRDGARLAGFKAFENYTGGVDLAVGNVIGDWRDEIIVSKLDGGGDVRVFTVDPNQGSLAFSLALEFKPFANAPPVGVRVAAGDVNGDGLADIITAAGAGWLPQVAIYRAGNGNAIQVSRFLVESVGFTDWKLSVSAGNVLGNRQSDVTVGLSRPGSVGRLLVFDGAGLPANQGGIRLPASRTQVWSITDRRIVVVARDADHDGWIDEVFVSPSEAGQVDTVAVLARDLTSIRSWRASDAAFQNGIELG